MIDVEVDDRAWTASVADVADLARASAGVAAALGEPGSIAILLSDDATVRGLNARFRGEDHATNVLSFPAPPNPEHHLGDITLAYGVCAAEARDQGKPLANHLRHLVIHGVLHLLGYDHQSDAEAKRMEAIECDLLAAMNVPDPYELVAADDGQQRR